MIGEQIVKVKDKKQRLKTLKRYIEEQINGDHGVGRSAVPFSLLTSGETRIAGERVDATLLRLPTEGCKVLTSKDRAPFSVLIEVSYRPRQKAAGKVSNRWCFDRFCCRRSQLVSSAGRYTPSPEPTIREVALRETFARHHSGSEDNLGRAVSSDKPLAQPKGLFGDKSWKEMRENVKRDSPFSSRPTWNLIPLIIKSRADDIRQEELAYRLVKWFQRVFKRRGLGDKLWLRPYIIVATTYDGGCLELMPDAISVHALKAYYGDRWVSLKHYFEQTFTENGKSPLPLHEALVNFVSSLAAYSIVCYVLAIRDRHNGNIMLSNEGHIIHIDYGFMLCGAPGGKMLQRLGGFEPSGGFKLPTEFVEVMGEEMFHQFRKSFVEGMMAVRDEAGELLAMLQLSMLGSENHSQPCFNHPKGYPEAVIEDVRARLKLTGEGTDGDSPLPEDDFRHFCEDMIDYSHGNWRSAAYDYVQYVQNGIR
jgi:phosphatidylinositol 4-kinase